MLSPNSHFFLESFFGVSRIGAILVPLNFRLTAEEHRYILNHAGVKVVLVDHEYAPVVDALRPEPRSIDARRIFTLIEKEGVTFACMAPAVLRAILDYPDEGAHAIKTRPRFTVAGAPPPAAFVERLEKDLGGEFLEIYGLTETAPLLDQPEETARAMRNGWFHTGDLAVWDEGFNEWV